MLAYYFYSKQSSHFLKWRGAHVPQKLLILIQENIKFHLFGTSLQERVLLQDVFQALKSKAGFGTPSQLLALPTLLPPYLVSWML